MAGAQRTVDIAVPPPGRVLIIDDSELIRGVIEDFLSEQGWKVVGAGSGEEGLEIARGWGAEAVLCDLQMPGMDGYEVLRHIRKLDPSLPVIFLSGESDVSIVLRAVEEGAFDYKLKDSEDLRPLVAALGRAVNYCRLTRENARLEKELASAKLESSRRLGQFIGQIGQELRAPLKVILDSADLLRQNVMAPSAPNTSEDVEAIAVASRHLFGIANELLDYSRYSLGKMSIASTSFDVRRTLSDVRDAMRGLAESSGGSIELELAEALGSIESDEGRVRQILLGLVANLCLRPKHGRIRIRAERNRDLEGSWVCFEIGDQSGGVEPQVLGQVFEPFSPVGRAKPPKPTELGPGLGLAMTRCLVQALGGEVGFRVEGGRGARFSLRLPARLSGGNTTADFMFPEPDDVDKTDKLPTAGSSAS